jgi:hypothetical protein
MPGWLYAVMLKAPIAVGIALAYYVLILLPVRWLRGRLPDNAAMRFLFRERGRYSPRTPTDPDQRVLE